MELGQSVICNGYPGTIIKVCTGQLTGMVEVRLASGVCCVDAADLEAEQFVRGLDQSTADYQQYPSDIEDTPTAFDRF
ncbi:MAG: hypothetical protein ACYDHZ_10790 [Dehalococcoidia bacterium]